MNGKIRKVVHKVSYETINLDSKWSHNVLKDAQNGQKWAQAGLT